MSSDLVPLTTFQGIPIHVGEGQLISLNDLWKAAGSPANQDPRQWLRLPQTAKFIAHLCRSLDVGKSHIVKTSRGGRGGGGGSWGHWKLALDYAAYLSEPLKDHIYQCFRERLEEEADPELGLQRWQERTERKYGRDGRPRDWIIARLRSILVRKLETDALQAHGIAESADYAKLTNETYAGLFGGTAKQLREQRGLPAKANLRDHMDETELMAVAFAETLARRKIERDNSRGYRAIAAAVRSSAENVGEAMRRDLGEGLAG